MEVTRRKDPKARPRNKQGLGSKWRRPDGRYGASIIVPRRDPITGALVRKKESTTRKTEEEVDAWLLAKRHEIMEAGGVLSEPEPKRREQTLAEHLQAWLADCVEPKVAPNTLQKCIWAASNHIAPELGHLLFSEVSPRDVQSLYARLSREGYSTASRREVHVTLRQALGQALRWGLISRNPASPELVDATKQKEARGQRDEDDEGEVRALSDEQARTLFTYAKAVGSRWRHYYVVAIRTGLRLGEALGGLKWGDLELASDPASLRVRRTLDTHHAARFVPPKSPASRRTLALHYEATEALLAQREMLKEEGLPAGKKALGFPSCKGTPMNSGNSKPGICKSTSPRRDCLSLPCTSSGTPTRPSRCTTGCCRPKSYRRLWAMSP